LIGVVLFVIGSAWVGLRAMAPDDFGELGPFRTSALTEERAKEIGFVGAETCGSNDCHPQRLADWTLHGHSTVSCEICHGMMPGAHAALDAERQPALAMNMPSGDDFCLPCHERLHGKPSVFDVIDIDQHYSERRLERDKVGCIICHPPHWPRVEPTGCGTSGCHERRTEIVHFAEHRFVTCVACHGVSLPAHALLIDGKPSLEMPTHGQDDLFCESCHPDPRSLDKHAKVLTKMETTPCIKCHSPHDPVGSARIEGLRDESARTAEPEGEDGFEDWEEWEEWEEWTDG